MSQAPPWYRTRREQIQDREEKLAKAVDTKIAIEDMTNKVQTMQTIDGRAFAKWALECLENSLRRQERVLADEKVL